MPPVVMGAPYWEPKLHALALKKLQPLNLTAGSASTSKVMNTNPSISTGTTAPPRPSQRIRPPLRAQARSDRLHIRSKRLEADSRQVLGARACRERPVQERLQRSGGRRVRLRLLYDRVLVVDDRVAGGSRGGDQRLSPAGWGGRREAGQRGIDGARGGLGELARLVG